MSPLLPLRCHEPTASGAIAAGSIATVASVGVGVVVKRARLNRISAPWMPLRALLAAKSVAYIDPASGGSSGSTSTSCSNGWVLPTRSGRKPNSRMAATLPIHCQRRC